MKQCLDDRLNRKLQEINTEYEFRIQAHDRRAIAQRAQTWSQYFQAVRERREIALETLNKQWYDVQSARRSAHSLPDYGLLFPRDPSQRVRNAIAYNTEVSTLAGLAKYEGFPAGPEMKGASAAELEADLNAMEVSTLILPSRLIECLIANSPLQRVRRGRQKPVNQVREEYQAPNLTRLGPAGEQFLKDTPWANPNHSAHKIFKSTHTPTETRPEQPVTAGRTPHQAHPPSVETKPTFDTPSSIQISPALTSRLSESPDMARSMLNQSVHPMKRVGSIPSLGRGPKAAAA